MFAVTTNGTGFTKLHDFLNDGSNPFAGLILAGDTLYGTTYYNGSVFKINTNGTGFTTVHYFGGASPYAELNLSGCTLYGTTYYGGSFNSGTVFSLSINPQLTIASDSTSGFFIHVTGVADVTYRLQRAASVTGTWSDLATNTAPASGLIEYHDTSPLTAQAFYRTVQP